jgi:hypothetical protein
MEKRRGNEPWYLIDRAHWLAYVYLSQDDGVRVDDVSDLDIGLDLLVRPGAGREEEDWTMGVVTGGTMSLPGDAEETDIGIRIPRAGLDFPSLSVLRDLPVFLAYYTMSDDQGYGTIVLSGRERALVVIDEVQHPARAGDDEESVSFFRLNEEAFRHLVDAEMQEALSRWTNDVRAGRDKDGPDVGSTPDPSIESVLRAVRPLLKSRPSSES